MKNSVITGFSFLLGMGIGAYVTYMYVKDMYAEIAQEEINSVKEAYAKKAKNLKRDDITEDEKKEKADKAYALFGEMNTAPPLASTEMYSGVHNTVNPFTTPQKHKPRSYPPRYSD